MRKFAKDYLFRRDGSPFWQLRLLGEKRVEVSLGTADRTQAEILAAEKIRDHKAYLLSKRPGFEPVRLYAAGETVQPDGTKIIGNGTEKATHIAADGMYLGQVDNPVISQSVTNLPAFAGRTAAEAVAYFDGVKKTAEKIGTKRATSKVDDEVIETYIRVNGFDTKKRRQPEDETRQMWALYEQLISKPLKDATRDDGRALNEHLRGLGDKSATRRKKIGRLGAAVNLAIKDGKLKFNPFAGVAPLEDDADPRLPFSAADTKLIFEKLDTLEPEDQLAIRIMATTGMRLGEVYQIGATKKNMEQIDEESGVRFVIIGTKTDSSVRRVPFPAALLPYLPAVIDKPLMTGDSNVASSRLNRWLDVVVGIKDPLKVASHSWRHRMADRLRQVGADEEIQHWILGHAKTVSMGYGHGGQVAVLKEWLDKVTPAKADLRIVASN